ncbi:probable 2-oxoglutarate-dependent dioxygenase ANS [Benincasa hispida]|uniref:probable 2-oxoglutarate-dependent dioxygenase ANS n=1 Tax=Benincasa hispida TaxID=102211 RepID=UPI0019018093|nr:probable 2-oxoglutarate-dependent dioxygenase ANS [Benincasa hispida]XP_038895433.1 probable 2-oxoglutarate-dependent dioxygenase ANS [Benincasa hispida]
MALNSSNSLGDGEPVIRVQKLVETQPSRVPPQYIQPPHHRPSDTNKSTDLKIPVIDLFGFDTAHRQAVRAAIGRESSEWGAFQVINHGIPLSLLNQMRTAALSFFRDCPVSDKLAYACDPKSFASEGYGTQMLLDKDVDSQSSVLDWRDYFDHHTLPLSRRNPSNWPHFPSNYRELMAQYSDWMKLLAQRLLALISETIGLPSSWMEDAITGMGAEEGFYQNITVSYYPPCPQPDLTLGLQSHSDIGAITLLIQDDVGGLQVLSAQGDWVTVQPDPDAIVVILADQTEILTNGKCKSAEHRVITNSRRARLSISAFHDPPKAVKILPAAELVSESSPLRYREVIYGDYTSSWYSNGPEGRRNLDAVKLHN